MGCGASAAVMHEEFGIDHGLEETQENSQKLSEPDIVIRAVSKARLESVYPWEVDGRQLPEDITVIFVLGAPGSGKSTQCQKLVLKHGATHLSSGDLLREEVATGTALGNWVKDLMQTGSLVPIQVTLTLLKKAMLAAASPIILIDGFPRALEQLALFERSVSIAHAAIFLDVSEEVAISRMCARGRDDDNAASIQQQWQDFQEFTLPVRQHFLQQGKGFVIDGSASTNSVAIMIEDVYKHVEAKRERELAELQAKAAAEHAQDFSMNDEGDADDY